MNKEDLALLPTEEDITFYEEHGWYISQKIIPDKIIDKAIYGSERFYRGERDGKVPVNSGYSNWKPEDGDTIRNNEFVSLQNIELRELALQPIIGAIAARLAKTNEIRLLDDQLVYKPPRDVSARTTVGWHCDHAYWATCNSHKLLTAWIPFHDIDESRGPLVVIDYSHKWSGLENMRYFNNPDLNHFTQQFPTVQTDIVKIPMSMKKGQVSFHNCWTIHGSYPNRSDNFRLSLAVHLQDQENFYHPYTDKKGKEIHIVDEKLCRKLADGSPDFSDPEIFPVLWSKT